MLKKWIILIHKKSNEQDKNQTENRRIKTNKTVQRVLKMYNFVPVCVLMSMVCLVTLNQPTTAINPNGTPIKFKQNQILRDTDDTSASAAINFDDQSAIDADDHSGSDGDHYNNDNEEIVEMSLDDQVRLLTKQMNALMTRRREDFKLLENNLKKSMRKNAFKLADADVRSELDKLR